MSPKTSSIGWTRRQSGTLWLTSMRLPLDIPPARLALTASKVVATTHSGQYIVVCRHSDASSRREVARQACLNLSRQPKKASSSCQSEIRGQQGLPGQKEEGARAKSRGGPMRGSWEDKKQFGASPESGQVLSVPASNRGQCCFPTAGEAQEVS